MIKKKVEVGGPLTNSELILMNILWDAQRPITGPEILAYVNASPEGPAFARTSYHAMVNNLLDKSYIISIGGCGHGKNQARQFIPALSRNEYYAPSSLRPSASHRAIFRTLFAPCSLTPTYLLIKRRPFSSRSTPWYVRIRRSNCFKVAYGIF